MLGLLGTKIGMTRVIQDDGRVIPLTVVKCDPNTITQVKTAEKDGYPALVLGFAALKKPRKTRKFRYLKEFKLSEAEAKTEYKKGDIFSVELFKEGDSVAVTGISKGKGTQGTIKRFNFSSGPSSHGSHFHREPGAVGTRAKPGRIHRGKKMAGRMGNETVTRKNVPVVVVDAKLNLLGIKGSIPGSRGNLVIIQR